MRQTVGIVASGVQTRLYANSYLDNTGYVTTPDAQAWTFTSTNVGFVITMKVLLRNPPNSGANQFMMSHWGTATADQSWLFYVTTTGGVNLQTRDTTLAARNYEILTPAEYAAYGVASPIGIGVRADFTTRFAALQSTDFVNWYEVGTPKTATSYTSVANATVPMGPAARPNTGADRYGGRVYMAQVHLGTDPIGAPLVRFDPNEHPAGATSWTDPRGRAWTLSLASAIVHA